MKVRYEQEAGRALYLQMISLASCKSARRMPVTVREGADTNTPLLVSFNDTEGSRILMVLHYEPRQCFLVLAVHLTGLDKFRPQFLNVPDRVGCIEMDDDCVHHFLFV